MVRGELYPKRRKIFISLAQEYDFRMSEDEQKFGGPIKRVIKAKPEELRRRLKTAKTDKDGDGINLQRVDKGSNRVEE